MNRLMALSITFIVTSLAYAGICRGKDFHARQGIWVGTKVGLFCVRPQVKTNDCGWMDVEWFRVRITDN